MKRLSADDGVSGGIIVVGVFAAAVIALLVINFIPKSNPLYQCTGCAFTFGEVAGGNFGIHNDVMFDAPGGGLASKLTTDPGRDGQPVWSPDGSRIAFVTDRDNTPGGSNYEIYVMNADGSNQTNLTNHDQFDEGPAWSPDGSKIVFASARDGLPIGLEPTNIYVMDADGSNVVRLTTGRIWDRWPTWSPDGTRIAFASKRQFVGATDESWKLDYEIWVMDPDGSNLVQLTDNDVDDMFPDWSPDGSAVVYSSGPVSEANLWVMDADGGNKVQFTDTTTKDIHPDFSPDGSRIVFASDREQPGGNTELYVMSHAGSQPEQVFGFGSRTFPDWRPLLQTAFSIIPPPPDAAETPTTTGATPTSSSPTSSTTAAPTTTTTTTTTAAACVTAPPVLLRPVDGSVASERLPLLEWAYREMPCTLSGQRIELAMDGGFATDVEAADLDADESSWQPDAVLADCTSYFWRVAPAVDGALGPFSDVSTFVTDFSSTCG